MNVLRFINSTSIRNHLKEINYSFNALESAWIVYQCRSASIAEKNKAWTEIVATMPDCEILKRKRCDYRPSLHKFLHEYMDFENRFLESFSTPASNSFYTYRLYDSDGPLSEPGTCFPSNGYYDCLLEVKRIMEEECLDGDTWIIRKKYGTLNEEAVLINAQGEPCRILPGELFGEDYSLFYLTFESMCFEFPVPFEPGDILWDPTRDFGECSGPFVFDSMNNMEYGDTNNICVSGYFQPDRKYIFKECTLNYMELEYYDEPLTGNNRALKTLSGYLKGEVGLDLLLNGYYSILLQGYAENIKRNDHYSREELICSGILEEDKLTESKNGL